MSASKIKKLIREYFDAYQNANYALHMFYKTKGKKKKEEFEEEADYYEQQYISIAKDIKAENPSKYMLNKYPEIEDILNENF